LRDFITESQQKELWEQFKAVLAPGNWPALVLPRWMLQFILMLCLTVFVAGVVIGNHLSRRVGSGLACGVTLAVSFGTVAALLARPYCTCIPTHIESIRDLIPHAITSDRMTGWSREEVAVVVKRIVTEQLGILESEYTEDLRFREDLNLL
jgi:hypothetical protein